MKDNNNWIVKIVREIYGDGRVSYDVVERGEFIRLEYDPFDYYALVAHYDNKTILTTPSQKEAEAFKKQYYDAHIAKQVISTSTIVKC